VANPGDRVLVFGNSLPRVLVGEVVESDERTTMVRLFDRHGILTESSESFRSSDLRPLSDYPRKDLPPGVLFGREEVVLQSVGGIFQLAEVLHDVKNGDVLVMLRLYVGPRDNITGVVTPTPVGSIIRPGDFLNDH
jgi:hypothetical protein